MSQVNHFEKKDLSFAGRADLLRFLKNHNDDGLLAMAEFAGYEHKELKPKAVPKGTIQFSGEVRATTTTKHRFTDSGAKIPFWMVISRRTVKPEELAAEKPRWAKGDDVYVEGSECADYEKAPPPLIPLVSWSRLWPFLKKSLGRGHESRSLDIRRIMEKISRFEPLKTLPLKPGFGWDPLGCLILDFDDRLLPIWDDINQLHHGIEKLRGKSGLDVYMVENGPEETFKKRDRRFDPIVDFKLPEPTTPVLILSDLGCLEKTGNLAKNWLRFGRRLNRSGIYPVVLNPASPDHWGEKLMRHFALVWWDRGNRAIRAEKVNIWGDSALDSELHEDDLRAERLLHLLSPAIRVEPELLRAVRMLFSVNDMDAAAEIRAWNHPTLARSYTAITYDNETQESYHRLFSKEPEHFRKQVIALIEQYHAHLSKAVAFEEKLISSSLESIPVEWTDEFIERFFRSIYGREASSFLQSLNDWFHRLSERQKKNKGIWKNNDGLAACWFAINRKDWERGHVKPPEGYNMDRVAWLINDAEKPVAYRLIQLGESFMIVGEDSGNRIKDDSYDTGSPVAVFKTRRHYLTVTKPESHEKVKTIPLHREKIITIPIPEKGPLILNTDMDEVVLDTLELPMWADSMGRDNQGLFVTLPEKDLKVYLPEWSQHVAHDEYGFFADFGINGITHRMRWIKPGRFMMGSSEDEPERDNDELLHEVVLTDGFWLGETTCTQKLWESVMGSNPSGFKGEKRPVENVSWDDCMEFIEKINGMMPGLDLRLPTEAEWEYACRAGTKTPFSFGENISTKQVNFDGNYPYNNGPKEEYRKETLDVKSFPGNDWGFYEMHGNVWEWCADWYGDYPKESVTDPKGPDSGENRVLRGGCWFDVGGNVRSANRGRNGPGVRDGSNGFRLARGHKARQGSAELKKRKQK